MKRAASLRSKRRDPAKFSASNRRKGVLSPHSSKKLDKSAEAAQADPLSVTAREARHRAFAGRGANYTIAFLNAGDRFWEQVQALTKISRTMLDKQKLMLGRHTLESINWPTAFPNPIPDRFVSAFVEAVRDRDFPKRRESQARFLGDSLGSGGDLSPRRSRDICGEERARAKRTHHIIRYEVYIECSCSYKGHSWNQACPKCGARVYFGWESPFGLEH